MESLIVRPPTWDRAHYQRFDDWMCPHRKEAHKNSVVTWNRDQSIFKLFLDFQLFFKLFLSFSMTGWSLFTKGGLGWRRPYIHTGWRELRNEDDWAKKADWWPTLLTSTLMMPSVATAARLYSMYIMQLHYYGHAGITLLNLCSIIL